MKLYKRIENKQYISSEPDIKRKGIMIVDDSRFSRNVLRDILINEGYDVVGEAKDGLEAIEMLKELRPASIFLDVEMPKLDGLGALPQILSFDPKVNVIMCTALGQKKIIIEATKAGAKDYVIKPYRRESIVGLLEALHPGHDGNVIPFQNISKSPGDVLNVEINAKKEADLSYKKAKYKAVSEYNQVDENEDVIDSFKESDEQVLHSDKGEILGEIRSDEERLHIHSEFEGLDSRKETDFSDVISEEIQETLAKEVGAELDKEEAAILEEEELTETIEESEAAILEEEELTETIEEAEAAILEEELTETIEEAETAVLEEEGKHFNHYDESYKYLWKNRFDSNQGLLSTNKTFLNIDRHSFDSIIKTDYVPIEILGQSRSQRWIRLGMMMAYMEKSINKIDIGKNSPSIRISFELNENRRLSSDFIKSSSNMRDITIAEIISNIDSLTEVDYYSTSQKHKQTLGLCEAISDIVKNKHQRSFSIVD